MRRISWCAFPIIEQQQQHKPQLLVWSSVRSILTTFPFCLADSPLRSVCTVGRIFFGRMRWHIHVCLYVQTHTRLNQAYVHIHRYTSVYNTHIVTFFRVDLNPISFRMSLLSLRRLLSALLYSIHVGKMPVSLMFLGHWFLMSAEMHALKTREWQCLFSHLIFITLYTAFHKATPWRQVKCFKKKRYSEKAPLLLLEQVSAAPKNGLHSQIHLCPVAFFL